MRGDQQQRQQVASTAVTNRSNAFQQELDTYTDGFAAMLPANVPVERFKRVLMTAVGNNPDLLYANRRTLYIAAGKCAADGLIPDNREAALVVYNTEVKQRNPETGLDEKIRMDVVQYMPMVFGVRKRMRNSGDILSAIAEAVHRNDTFKYRLGDDPFIEHDPPPLGDERGEVIGAYAIIKLKSGEVIRDVMDRPTIELARNVSRGKEGPMWKNFYHEAAKKTVLRRAAKQAPQSAELEALLYRDEEPPLVGELTGLAAPERPREPEPQRPAIEHEDGLRDPQIPIITLDGEELIFRTVPTFLHAIRLVFDEAAKLGSARLEGAFESNQQTIDGLPEGYTQEHADLLDHYGRLLAEAKARESAPEARTVQERPPAATAPPAPPVSPPPAPSAAPPAPREPPPFPGDLPSARQVEPEVIPPPANDTEKAREIPPVMRGNKPDWHKWAFALFVPKVKQHHDSAEFAMFLGANDEHLTAARAVLGPREQAELQAAIDTQWQAI